MDLTLKGARVIVTAGAGGIGRAIVEGFLAEGASVATCDIDEAALAKFGAEIAVTYDPGLVDDREALLAALPGAQALAKRARQREGIAIDRPALADGVSGLFAELRQRRTVKEPEMIAGCVRFPISP